METNKAKELEYKLNRVDKLLFIINDNSYVLSTRLMERNEKNESLLYGAVRYYNKLLEIYFKGDWNSEDEQLLLKYMKKVMLYLKDWDTTPTETIEIINNFNDEELSQLENQLDMYLRIKEELYPKHKKW